MYQMKECLLFYMYRRIKSPFSLNFYKVRLFWIVMWMTLVINKAQWTPPTKDVQLGYPDDEVIFYREGDLLIGGVFTISAGIGNTTGIDAKSVLCCAERDAKLFLNVLALNLAISNINQNPEILPNITLGFHITDSCLYTSMAVRSLLSILSGPQKTVPNYYCSGEDKLVGFIGGHFSLTTIPMAQILGIYGYTQISYGATDYSLTNRFIYPHVFRTLQNDHVQYMTIVKLLKLFGWTWVGILASEDDEGDKVRDMLTKYLNSNGICVEFTISIGRHMYINKIENGYKLLNSITTMNKSTAKVIVVCGSYLSDNTLIWYSDVFYNKTFIFPPLWSPSPSLVTPMDVFNGSLAVELHPLIFPDKDIFFDEADKIKSLNNVTESLHLLLLARCMSANKDNKNSSILCPEFHNTSFYEFYPNLSNFVHQGTPSRIYYAVKAMAEALHDMNQFYKAKYDNKQHHYYRHKLYNYLKKIKYSFDSNEPVPFFNEDGEFVHKFKIINWVHEDEYNMIYKDVGDFTPWAPEDQQFQIDIEAITWKFSNEVPESRCSRPCLPGSRKKFGSSVHKCCYECVTCPEGEISNASAVSILCCLLTGLILGIFIHYQDTPIVKANNRNLSYLLLVSIMLSFLCVFLFLGRPVDVTCMLRVTSFGVIFSFAVSSLLAKSIMVYIAFKSTKPGSFWKKWLGGRFPISIMSLCSLIQVIICVTWLSISPPFQDRDTHTYQGKIIIQCNEGSVIGFYSVLGYMGLLAAISFIIAFLARTLPDSFNETKYITFSMLVFCSVWIAMIPAYLSTKGKDMVAVQIFAIMASNAGLLGCIFFPKCYIILFRPDSNTKIGLLRNK
ncbi:vomeronasal type-2 receptor 26-like [Lithobates pipiens]